MSDRFYRTLLGLLILVGLYFELNVLMYGLIAVLFLEGLSNLRVPILVARLQNAAAGSPSFAYDSVPVENARYSTDSERVWRMVVGGFLLLGYVLIDALWFFSWFMGFAIFGAGLSGVCPVLLAIRWLGFR